MQHQLHLLTVAIVHVIDIRIVLGDADDVTLVVLKIGLDHIGHTTLLEYHAQRFGL